MRMAGIKGCFRPASQVVQNLSAHYFWEDLEKGVGQHGGCRRPRPRASYGFGEVTQCTFPEVSRVACSTLNQSLG